MGNTQTPKPRKGIYLLPNLLTLGGLFGGFYAVVMAMNGHYSQACIGIFAAMILDSLDGRIARLTHTQTAFGEQMDSLADMVSFGAAPSFVMYEWALRDLGRWGWLAAFVYCACAALRLARFNVNIETVNQRYFQGLPSPAAAGCVMGLVSLVNDAGPMATPINWLAFFLTLCMGLTMVSNLPFYSFKDLPIKKSVPFVVIVLVALGIAAVNIYPSAILFASFLIYSLSGYFVYLYRRMKGYPVSLIATSTQAPEEQGLHR